nr:hypothetical protein [uncultured Enterobacter sp.]
MTVTHNGKIYTAERMADRMHWRLSEVGAPRNTVTLNRDQMMIAGFGHVIEPCIVDTKSLRAALSKKAIARCICDDVMLQQAIEAQRKALGIRVNRNSFEVRA